MPFLANLSAKGALFVASSVLPRSTEQPEFRIASSMTEGVLTIRVVGDLDIDSAPQLSAALVDYLGIRALVVDLSACEFMDSSGIRELLRCRNEIGWDAPMRLVGAPSNLLSTFQLAGLADVITIDASPARP